jgi:voltage-gated potassium channel Kch
MAVGATIDLKAIAESPLQTGLLVVGVMLCKAGVLLGLQRMNKNTLPTSILVTAALCQVGEFAFVLLTFARSIGVLSSETAATGVVVTALSMALSPLVLVGSERLGPLLGKKEPERESDVVDEHNPVLIAGFGRFGQIAGRLLRSHGVKVTILDVDSDQIELMARLGNKVYYGDASRLDLLESAKAGEAKLLIVAVDEHEKAREIVRLAKKHFPALKILCRARGRTEAYELLELGVEQIYRETFDSSLRLGEDALQLLGFHPYQARRAVQFFRKHDEASVRELAKHRHDLNTLVQSARERVAALEEVLKQDAAEAKQLEDHGWDVKLKP